MFKYVLAPNALSWRRRSFQCDSSYTAKAAIGDRLSGDNLKILLETINVAHKTKCSGIEDIKDRQEKCSGALKIEQRLLGAITSCDKDAELETSKQCQEKVQMNGNSPSLKKDN